MYSKHERWDLAGQHQVHRAKLGKISPFMPCPRCIGEGKKSRTRYFAERGLCPSAKRLLTAKVHTYWFMSLRDPCLPFGAQHPTRSN